MGEHHPLGNTAHPDISKAFGQLLGIPECSQVAPFIRNQFGKWTSACIVNVFENLATFIVNYLTVRFMACLRATENVNGPKVPKTCLLLQSSYFGETLRVFILHFFVTTMYLEQIFRQLVTFGKHRPLWRCYPTHDEVHGNIATLTVTGVKLQSWFNRVIMGIVRGVLTREKRWY